MPYIFTDWTKSSVHMASFSLSHTLRQCVCLLCVFIVCVCVLPRTFGKYDKYDVFNVLLVFCIKFKRKSWTMNTRWENIFRLDKLFYIIPFIPLTLSINRNITIRSIQNYCSRYTEQLNQNIDFGILFGYFYPFCRRT